MLEWIQLGGLPLIFILVFLEGNPIIGSFVPGQIIVIILGFLISTTEIFNLYLTILLVFLAGFLGDMAGYYFGKNWGLSGLKYFGISSKSSIYNSSCSFFKRFGSLSIILGREFNFTRAFIPFFAGLLGMNFSRFFILALISNLIWTLISIFLGYYFGYVVIDKIQFLFGFILFVIVYLLILYFIYNSFRTFYKQNRPTIRKYALENILSASLFLILFFVMIIVEKVGLLQLFNDYFSFLYSDVINAGFALIFNFYAFLCIVFLFVLLMTYNKRYRLMFVFFIGIFVSFFLTLIFRLMLEKWVGFTPYYSIIFFVFLVFFISYLSSDFFKKEHYNLKLRYFLIFFLILSFFIKVSVTENFYRVLISFLIAAIECELVVIITHYRLAWEYLK